MANGKAEHGEGSARSIFPPPAIIMTGFIAFMGILALMPASPAYAQQPLPNEVIVYEDIDYTGAHISWKLEPGMRQKLVPYVGEDLDNKVSSIRVGSDVGVAVFQDASYGGGFACFEMTQTASQEPADFEFEGFDNMISSLIIFAKPMKGPQGVFLGASISNLLFGGGLKGRFFPLPELMNQASAKYPVLGPEWDNFFDFGTFDLGTFNPALKPADYGGYVEVVLYDQYSFGGKSITLPWKDSGGLFPLFGLPSGEEGIFELANYDFAAIASSLEVRWVDTSHVRVSAPPAPDTPQNPPDPSGRTPPPPGPDIKKAPADKKQSIPLLPVVTGIGISGQWNSNIGAVYQIQQSGNQFTWSAPSLNQSGTGTISGKSITLSGPGWTVKGQVTETDTSGNPAKIVGENGVVLMRAAAAAPGAPIAPSVIGLAGQWKSSIGRVYDITQQGNQIAWTVVNSDEKGQGTITGGDVSASWKGFLGSGSSSGKITVDSSGKATEIKWSNGVRFYR